MNRAQKEAFVSDLSSGLKNAQAFALMSFNKMTVEQMTQFRLSMRKRSIRIKVVKNTLAKRVLSDTAYAGLSNQFEGPTLIAFSPSDPVITAKAICEWADKENIGLKIKSGAALGQMMTDQQLKALSRLPGRNEMFVSFLWALKSSPTKFLYALQDAPRRLGYALAALQAKKEKEAQ